MRKLLACVVLLSGTASADAAEPADQAEISYYCAEDGTVIVQAEDEFRLNDKLVTVTYDDEWLIYNGKRFGSCEKGGAAGAYAADPEAPERWCSKDGTVVVLTEGGYILVNGRLDERFGKAMPRVGPIYSFKVHGKRFRACPDPSATR